MEKVFELSNLTLESAALKAADPSWSIRLGEEGGGSEQPVSTFQAGIKASGSAISGVALYTLDIEVYPEPTEEVPDPEPTIWPAGYYLCLQAVMVAQGEEVRAIAWYNDNPAVPVTALDEDGNPAGEVQWLYLGTDPDTTLPVVLTVTDETAEIRKQYSIEHLFCEPEDVSSLFTLIPVPANTPLPGGKTAADIQGVTFNAETHTVEGTTEHIYSYPEVTPRIHNGAFLAFTLDYPEEYYDINSVSNNGSTGFSHSAYPDENGMYLLEINHTSGAYINVIRRGSEESPSVSLLFSCLPAESTDGIYLNGYVDQTLRNGSKRYVDIASDVELIQDAQDETKWTLTANELHYQEASGRLAAGYYLPFTLYKYNHTNYTVQSVDGNGTEIMSTYANSYANNIYIRVTSADDKILIINQGTTLAEITLDQSIVFVPANEEA